MQLCAVAGRDASDDDGDDDDGRDDEILIRVGRSDKARRCDTTYIKANQRVPHPIMYSRDYLPRGDAASIMHVITLQHMTDGAAIGRRIA